jgi:hypothetical protein
MQRRLAYPVTRDHVCNAGGGKVASHQRLRPQASRSFAVLKPHHRVHMKGLNTCNVPAMGDLQRRFGPAHKFNQLALLIAEVAARCGSASILSRIYLDSADFRQPVGKVTCRLRHQVKRRDQTPDQAEDMDQ